MASHIVYNENLVVQIEHQFFDWKSGGPLLISYLVFKKSLGDEKVGPTLNSIYLEPEADFKQDPMYSED